jgi:drug/metabolite transporter (DMT)-like permease
VKRTGHSPRLATLAGAGAIALWAFLAVLTRSARAVPPLEITALGFSVSAVLGLLVLGRNGRLAELRQRPLAWLHGVGGLFGYHALYFAALGLAPVAEANLLNYTWPLLIVLFSALLLRMRLGWLHIGGMVLGVAGCALVLGRNVSFGATGEAMLGYAFAAGAGGVWALYSVTSRRLSAVPTGAVAGFCAATAVLAAIAHFLFEPTVVPDATALLAMVLMGIGPVGAAFFLWDIGMKHGDPRLLGTLAYATPIASTLLLCLGGFAPFTPGLLAAAALVAAGGLVAARASTAAPSTP